MHRRFRPRLAAEHHVGARRDHLVYIHIGLRAGAGLPHDQGKMVVEFAVDHLLRRTRDRLGAPRVEQAELDVHFGCGTLDDGERADDRLRHALLADPEVAAWAFSLRPPQAVGRDGARTRRVGFGAGVHAFADNRKADDTRQGAGTPLVFIRPLSSVLYFLRKRSRRTTSPPPAGLSGPSSELPAGGLAGFGAAATVAVGRADLCSAA